MRWGLLVVACAMAGCAESRFAATPPAGVDLSGHWALNIADSDDAQRLMQSQIAAATVGVGEGDGGNGRNRGGGRRGLPTAPMGPAMPPVAVLDESLRWPGRDLTLKQSGDFITFVSDGSARSCHPTALKGAHPHRPADNDRPQGRDMPSRGRGDAPAPRCGWDERSLVVRSGEPDDDSPPFEQRFSLSDDGRRLVEVVVFRGAGRSNGFVASREWDHAPAVPAGAPRP